MSDIFPVQSEPWQPHSYQKRAVKFLLEHACGALLLDPGLGKTSITLAAIKVLKKKQLLSKVLLIAPLRPCYMVWPGEIQKWSDFNHLRYEILHGPDKEAALRREADIYIINPEGLDWLLRTEKTKGANKRTSVRVGAHRFKALGFDTLVIDELSRFKHTNTNRFKALKQVLSTFSRRWGLTGSPMANGLMDLFGQCYVLDMGNALGQYITHYRSSYFVPDHTGFGWNPQEGAEERIYKRLQPLALRMAAEDYLELPELVENTIQVNLPPKVQELYNRLEEDAFAMLGARAITAATAGAAVIKCRQVAAGGLYLTPEVEELVRAPKGRREWVNLHDEKTNALADLVEELQGASILVAYDFNHDIDRLKKGFPKGVFCGDYTARQLVGIERAWNGGEIEQLFGHPQTIALGLNLQQRGNHVCFHTPTWDFELYDQYIRRIWRQGNKAKRVFVHRLIAKGTIEETMIYALRHKNKCQQAFFEALKKMRKGRK